MKGKYSIICCQDIIYMVLEKVKLAKGFKMSGPESVKNPDWSSFANGSGDGCLYELMG